MTHATHDMASDANNPLVHKRSNSLDSIPYNHEESDMSDENMESKERSHSVEYSYNDDDLENCQHDEFLATEDWLTHSTYYNANTQGVSSSGKSSNSTDDLPITSQATIVTHATTHIKQPSKFRNFVVKTKEHLRDEENRRKVVQYVRTGVREVAEFVAEVQKSDGLGKRGGSDAAKGNGKKLAKVCVKVVMKKLAK
jgi:hypothetical protein